MEKKPQQPEEITASTPEESIESGGEKIEREIDKVYNCIIDMSNRDFLESSGNSARLEKFHDILRRLSQGEILPEQALKEAEEIRNKIK